MEVCDIRGREGDPVVRRLQSVDVVEVLASLFDTVSHGELGLSDPIDMRGRISVVRDEGNPAQQGFSYQTRG
jgi:hypothetical protein